MRLTRLKEKEFLAKYSQQPCRRTNGMSEAKQLNSAFEKTMRSNLLKNELS